MTNTQQPTTSNEQRTTSNQHPASSNQKRVLMLLTNAFDPDPRVHQEAKALVDAGYDVTILCWDRDTKAPAYEVIDAIKVERIYVKSTHGRGSTQILFLIFFWLKAFLWGFSREFNIVHCHDFDTLPIGYIISRQKKSKLVYDAHESYVDMLENVPGWLKKIIFGGENLLLKRVDLLITVGEILRKAFEGRGAKQTCVVGNWKDPEQFQFPQKMITAERARLGVKNGELVISFIANLGRERQLHQLIQAVGNDQRFLLIIGGTGPCQDTAIEASQHYNNVKYLGYVPPLEVPRYTVLCDMVFYGFDPSNPNSKYSAPNKLFEALACGKAVLTGDFGEIGKIVKEVGCGFILKDFSANEIKSTLSHLSLEDMNRAKANAVEAGENKYNWKKARVSLLLQYRSLHDKTAYRSERGVVE